MPLELTLTHLLVFGLRLGRVTTTHHIIDVPNYIQPQEKEAAYQVASNLRQEDLEEVVEGR